MRRSSNTARSNVVMNDRNRLLKELMGILEDELGTAPEGVSEETFLRESLGLDSVDMITVISRVEQAYKIRLNHEELTQMNKVSDIINVILSKTEVTPMRAAA
jgi:acyl carrier protein